MFRVTHYIPSLYNLALLQNKKNETFQVLGPLGCDSLQKIKGASHRLLSRAIVISQMWYRFYVSQSNPLIFGMWGAKWVNKRKLKGFVFSDHFLTIFVHFFTFRPKNRKIAKNGQKMAGEKNPFKLLLLTHFAPYMPKIRGLG